MSTQTKTAEKTQPQNIAQDQPQHGKQQVAVLQPPRLPYHPVYEQRYGIDGMSWRALVDGVYPSAKTPEGIILAVSYCKAKGYDIMKKMIHIVPIWNSALGREVEGIWEGVAALRATAFRTGEYAGCDETKFGPMIAKHFEGEVGKGQYAKHVEADLEFPEWAQVTVYRIVKGVRCAFPGPKVHWLAAYGCQGKSDVPNDKWSEGGGSYMLEKCAEAAALRKAFPEELGGLNAAEEMEGRRVAADAHKGHVVDHESEPTPPRPTRESVKRDTEAARKQAYESERQFRETMREDDDHRPQEKVIHDAETGEVEVDAAQEPERATEGANEPAQATAQEPQRPAPDYQKLCDELCDKVSRASTRKFLEGFVTSRGQDIDTLRTEAPALSDVFLATLKARRDYFAK